MLKLIKNIMGVKLSKLNETIVIKTQVKTFCKFI